MKPRARATAMVLATDIRNMRLAVEALLDAMRLHAYTYTLEHKPDGWMLRIECGTGEAWQAGELRVDADELAASLVDPRVREKLWRDWMPHLQACMTQQGAGSSTA